MGDGHGGIDKVASSCTLLEWSPPWTRATVTLLGLVVSINVDVR